MKATAILIHKNLSLQLPTKNTKSEVKIISPNTPTKKLTIGSGFVCVTPLSHKGGFNSTTPPQTLNKRQDITSIKPLTGRFRFFRLVAEMIAVTMAVWGLVMNPNKFIKSPNQSRSMEQSKKVTSASAIVKRLALDVNKQWTIG